MKKTNNPNASYALYDRDREAKRKAQTASAGPETPHKTLPQGTRVIANGYPGIIVRQYDGDMYEIRLASGLVCTDDWKLATRKQPQPAQDCRSAAEIARQSDHQEQGEASPVTGLDRQIGKAMRAAIKEAQAQGEADIEQGATLGALIDKHKQGEASPLPWTLQNGAIYDASDNGRVQNVRLCKLVVSSTAIELPDARLIVASVNHADKLAEAGERLKNAVSDLINEPRTLEIEHYAETALHGWEQTLAAWEARLQ